ncbi:hypothetical protein A4U61_03225 [Streptomyces sp. H-KF8]|nr:hypothetical protein A4U61_03225 [Streptomyces sp. H-KF8]
MPDRPAGGRHDRSSCRIRKGSSYHAGTGRHPAVPLFSRRVRGTARKSFRPAPTAGDGGDRTVAHGRGAAAAAEASRGPPRTPNG